MEKILRKLLYKWLVYNIDNYDHKEDMRILMNDNEQKEYATSLRTMIEAHIDDIIGQIKDSIDDVSGDIEFNMNIKLDELREDKDIDDDDWEVEIEEDEDDDKVICNTAGECKNVQNGFGCEHHEPHVKNVDCGTWCAWKINDSNADCVDFKEKEKNIKRTLMDNKFGRAVKCSESDNCDFKDCMHSKSHIFNNSCISECVNKTQEVKIIECI